MKGWLQSTFKVCGPYHHLKMKSFGINMYVRLENTVTKKWIGQPEYEGTWAQLDVEDNQVCLKRCKNIYGNVAIGPIINIEKTTDGVLVANVDSSPGIKKTDIFDTSKRYPVNAALYIVDAKLTTSKEDAQKAMADDIEPLSVGIVVDPPSAVYSTLTYYRYS